MKAGIAALVLAYVLSQFYRVFLAVLAPTLGAEIGVGAVDLARASGLWFAAFALMQFPVGWALDRIGPRATVSVLLGAGGGGGALVFSAAQGPGGIAAAMILIGVGCSPVLMGAYFIFARMFSPAVFGVLAGAIIGLGGVGNLAATVPLASAITAFGWRASMAGLGAVTLMVACLLAVVVRDPARVAPSGTRGTFRDLLRIRALWFILPMMGASYGPAVAVRGLWAGPYLAENFDLGAVGIGRVTLLMALAMIAGNFAYGPADRWFGTRKGVVLTGSLVCAAAFGVLAVLSPGLMATAALMALLGFSGASYSMIMAHGRAFLPPPLLGRGVTLINFFGIAGAGLMQAASGPLHGAGGFPLLFGFFTLLLLAGCALYAFAEDRTD